MKKAVFQILILSIMIHIVSGIVFQAETSGYLSLFTSDESLTTFWVRCEMVYKFGITLSYYIYATNPMKSKKLSLLLLMTLGLVANDILDEMFFDPFTYQLNEIAMLITIITTALWYAKRT